MQPARPERLLEYFVLIGPELPLQPLPQESVQEEEPISDLLVVDSPAKTPEGYTLLSATVGGSSADLNRGGVFTSPAFLCYSRNPGISPITDVMVLDPKDKCPPGYTALKVPPSRNSSPIIAVSRAHGKPPIVDIALLSCKHKDLAPLRFRTLPRSLNAGSIKDDLLIAVRHGDPRLGQQRYKAVVHERFPRVNIKGAPLPDSVALFCYPEGVYLAEGTPPLPTRGSFVLTTSSGLDMYAATVTFWEPLSDSDAPVLPPPAPPPSPEQSPRAGAVSSSANRGRKGSLAEKGREDGKEEEDEGGRNEIIGMEQIEELIIADPLTQSLASKLASLKAREDEEEEEGDIDTSPTERKRRTAFSPRSSPSPSPSPSPSFGPGPKFGGKVGGSGGKAKSGDSSSRSSSGGSTKSSKQRWAPWTICILSYWPFFDCFTTWLCELYRLSVGHTSLPIERYLTNLWETPLPRTSHVNVELQIAHTRILFDRPPPDDFPLANFSFERLFQCLRLEQVCQVLAALLLERKVILTSAHTGLLTPVAEALRALIFPFQWCYAYVPVLPVGVVGILDAPMPVFVGLPASLAARLPVAATEDTCLVDLDEETVRFSGSREFLPLPAPLLTRLESELKQYAGLGAIKRFSEHAREREAALSCFPGVEEGLLGDEPETQEEFNVRACRAAFLHVFVSLLANYRDYLLFPVVKAGSPQPTFQELFDNTGFLSHCPRAYKPFLSALVQTQMFARFVEEATYGSGQKKSPLAFFDACVATETQVAALKESARQKLGASASLVQQLTQPKEEPSVYRVPPPNSAGLPETPNGTPPVYRYQHFPRQFDLSLFGRPRAVNIQYMQEANEAKRSRLNADFEQAFVQQNSSSGLAPVPGFLDGVVLPNANEAPAAWAKLLLRCIYACWFELQCVCISKAEDPNQAILNIFTTLKEMTARGVLPDEGIYRSILIVCGKYHKKYEAQIIFDAMKKSGIKPSSQTYGSYAAALAEGSSQGSGDLGPAQTEIFAFLGSPSPGQHHRRTSSLVITPERASQILAGDPFAAPASDDPTQEKIEQARRERVQWKTLRMAVGHTCSVCCRRLTEAEIMAGWKSDANAYVANCVECGNSYVPMLRISVVVQRELESEQDRRPFPSLLPLRSRKVYSARRVVMSVPFLCPLVLRKELTAATEAFFNDFQDSTVIRALHGSLFWNLLFAFTVLVEPALSIEHLIDAEEAGVSQTPMLGLFRSLTGISNPGDEKAENSESGASGGGGGAAAAAAAAAAMRRQNEMLLPQGKALRTCVFTHPELFEPPDEKEEEEWITEEPESPNSEEEDRELLNLNAALASAAAAAAAASSSSSSSVLVAPLPPLPSPRLATAGSTTAAAKEHGAISSVDSAHSTPTPVDSPLTSASVSESSSLAGSLESQHGAVTLAVAAAGTAGETKSTEEEEDRTLLQITLTQPPQQPSSPSETTSLDASSSSSSSSAAPAKPSSSLSPPRPRSGRRNSDSAIQPQALHARPLSPVSLPSVPVSTHPLVDAPLPALPSPPPALERARAISEASPPAVSAALERYAAQLREMSDRTLELGTERAIITHIRGGEMLRAMELFIQQRRRVKDSLAASGEQDPGAVLLPQDVAAPSSVLPPPAPSPKGQPQQHNTAVTSPSAVAHTEEMPHLSLDSSAAAIPASPQGRPLLVEGQITGEQEAKSRAPKSGKRNASTPGFKISVSAPPSPAPSPPATPTTTPKLSGLGGISSASAAATVTPSSGKRFWGLIRRSNSTTLSPLPTLPRPVITSPPGMVLPPQRHPLPQSGTRTAPSTPMSKGRNTPWPPSSTAAALTVPASASSSNATVLGFASPVPALPRRRWLPTLSLTASRWLRPMFYELWRLGRRYFATYEGFIETYTGAFNKLFVEALSKGGQLYEDVTPMDGPPNHVTAVFERVFQLRENVPPLELLEVQQTPPPSTGRKRGASSVAKSGSVHLTPAVIAAIQASTAAATDSLSASMRTI